MSRLSAFHRALGGVALVALAVRVLYALSMRHYPVVGDAFNFHVVAQGIADGHGFREVPPLVGPTAEHPPLFEVFLAFFDKLGLTGYEPQRIVISVLGTLNIVLIGLLGRAIAGARAGVVAAALAAVYPLLWTADGALMSEPLYLTFVLLSLLVGLRLRTAPTVWRAAALGVTIALAALTRGEGLALVVLLAAPLIWRAVPTWRRRGVLLAATLAAIVVVLAPWTIRNAIRFEQPVLISTNSNGLFIGANCPQTYYGPLIGSWYFDCYTQRLRPGEDESAYFLRQRQIGVRYAKAHAGRLPKVILARLGRELDVYQLDQALFFNASEGRSATWVKRGIYLYWLVGLLALAGIAVLARRRERTALLVLGAPIVMVLLVAIVTYGTTRFRYAAEPSLIVLAAITLTSAAGRLARARAPRG